MCNKCQLVTGMNLSCRRKMRLLPLWCLTQAVVEEMVLGRHYRMSRTMDGLWQSVDTVGSHSTTSKGVGAGKPEGHCTVRLKSKEIVGHTIK